MTNLEMYRGDTVSFNAVVQDNTGTPIDVSGWAFTFTAKHSVRDDDADAVISLTTENGGIEVVNAGSGELRLTIPSDATASLDNRAYLLEYDLQGVSATDQVHTVQRGRITVRADVTRTAGLALFVGTLLCSLSLTGGLSQGFPGTAAGQTAAALTLPQVQSLSEPITGAALLSGDIRYLFRDEFLTDEA